MAEEISTTRRNILRGLPLAAMAASLPRLAEGTEIERLGKEWRDAFRNAVAVDAATPDGPPWLRHTRSDAPEIAWQAASKARHDLLSALTV
jgi:hypothetical protein